MFEGLFRECFSYIFTFYDIFHKYIIAGARNVNINDYYYKY